MTTPLIEAFLSVVQPMDSKAEGGLLSIEMKDRLRSNPLLESALFSGEEMDCNVWRSLLWASGLSAPIQLFWPQPPRNPQALDTVIRPLRRYSRRTVSESPCFTRDGQNRIDDNLIIHGENLGVLKALNSDFSKRIKLCYIDPPYGTGSGDFLYRDQFKTSEWLTFISDRVEALKPLLAPDGVVIVQCSFHHHARLEALLKSHFSNHLCTLHLQVRHPERQLTADKQFNDIMEQALIFSPDSACRMPKRRELRNTSEYIYTIETDQPSRRIRLDGRDVAVFEPGSYRLIKSPPTPGGLRKISIRGTIREKNNSGRIYVRSIEPLAPGLPPMTLFRYPGIGADGLGFRYFYTPAAVADGTRRRKNGGYFQGLPLGDDHVEKPHANFMNWESDYNRVRNEGGVDLRNGKKPERLMAFFIKSFTSPGDWVLDYHLGSGTTCAVSHKLGRRYIGIEQMAYAETKAARRLEHVVGFPEGSDPDATGISENIGWCGGGEFVFCRGEVES